MTAPTVASSDEKFDYAISNPPYQRKSEAVKKTATNVVSIFHLFQLAAMNIAESTVMIYPAGRWIQGGGQGLRKFGQTMLSDPGLGSIDILDKRQVEEFFPGVGITDGVGIVHWDSRRDNFGIISLNGTEVTVLDAGILPLDPMMASIISKVAATCNDKGFGFVSGMKQTQKLFGVESDFAEKNPDKVALCEDHPDPPKSLSEPIKVLTNDRAGKTGRPKWHWMSKADVPRGAEYVDKWQFVIKSAQFPHETNQISNGLIIAAGEAFGRSKVSLGAFDTEAEARNFAAAMSTLLFTRLYRETLSGGLTNLCAFVPDLGDYTSGNTHVDWTQPLDEQLYDLFGLTQDEIKVIENR